MAGPLEGISDIRNSVRSKRISSYDRTGGNDDYIPIGAGETAILADIPGAGIIKHIWITVNSADAFIRRNAVLRMYWDGETEPSVEAPLGDFFGQGWGEEYNYVSLPLASAPSRGRALNCYFPMPFGNGARIELDNQSDDPIRAFYYYIDYEIHPEMPDSKGRFHAWWNRELTEAHPDEGETEWSVVERPGEVPREDRGCVGEDIEGIGEFGGGECCVDRRGAVW